jgi:hypothetical protein
VEAFAVMGRVHPFFEKGGMGKRSEDGGLRVEDGGVVYYLFDRGVKAERPTFNVERSTSKGGG